MNVNKLWITQFIPDLYTVVALYRPVLIDDKYHSG